MIHLLKIKIPLLLLVIQVHGEITNVKYYVILWFVSWILLHEIICQAEFEFYVECDLNFTTQ